MGLTGQTGPAGDPGPRGPRGPRGRRGAPGLAGPGAGPDSTGTEPGSGGGGSSSDATCDANYSGCVPADAGDVNCTDLSDSDIEVIGEDIYGLDRDGDGIACES
jgi:hypothetical protein